MTIAMILSPAKTNRLFWLGRYAERVYTSLHLVRKYLDKMIDSDFSCYKNFCAALGVADEFSSAEDFRSRYLYDEQCPMSLISTMRYAFDNAIELREEIKSENLSYIELALNTLRQCATTSAKTGALQPVTDDLLAFWGGLEERIPSQEAKDLLRFGRMLESLDLHIRFHYSPKRIKDIYTSIPAYAKRLSDVYDHEQYDRLEELMEGPADTESADFRCLVLAAINTLFIVSL